MRKLGLLWHVCAAAEFAPAIDRVEQRGEYHVEARGSNLLPHVIPVREGLCKAIVFEQVNAEGLQMIRRGVRGSEKVR
jgi:hypothetical protein